MLDITNLTYRIAGRVLLDNASVRISEGHRIGLIGRNGTGKSTLFKLITGEIEPDAGSVSLPRGLRLGVVAQEVRGDEGTPLEYVLAADTERAALLAEADVTTDGHRQADIQTRLLDIDAYAAPARAAIILNGLGFDAEAQNRPLSAFSGGWRMRAALAAALFSEPDLLLLDEPTNHLDLEAALWLEGFLKSWPKTLILISHDRDFLNVVVTGIVHLERLGLYAYSGTYDSFEKQRNERLAQTEAAIAKQAAVRAHLQSFIDRFKAKASKAKQAQSRVKALSRMEPLEAINRDPEVRFNFPDPEELAPPMILLDGASVGYDNKPILKNIGLRLDPDDRVALLGANGNGKTTLAKLIAGRLEVMDGERVAPNRLRVGYFAQHQVDELNLTETPIQAMTRVMPSTVKPEKVRAALGAFGFGGEKAQTKIGALSGGEKARLTLALITYDAPHLLILDEPTNHLDIEARTALVEALTLYSGAVILVSHDRRMVEMVADRLWLVAHGTATPFEGDMDEYQKLILSGSLTAPGGKGGAGYDPNLSKAEQRKANVERRAAVAPLKKAVTAAEQAMAKIALEKAKIDAKLTDSSLYDGPKEKLNALLKQQGELGNALAAAEAAWLEAVEALDAAQAA